MSKNKAPKRDNVYMQIEKFGDREPYLLQVPEHYRLILDKLMANEEDKDHRSCKAVLKIFCEEFMALDEDEQDKVETLINSRIRQLDTIYDLLEIMMQRDKYYVLLGVDTKQKLGEFHIFAARRSNPDSWIAKSDYADAKQVGRQIKQIEKGEFYRNDYVGRYCCLTKEG